MSIIEKLFQSKKKIMYLAGFFIIVFILGYSLSYYHCSTSGAYLKAEEFVKSNDVLKTEVEQIQSTRMGFLNFLIFEKNGEGNANFSILVNGRKKSVKVSFELNKENDNWLIKNAKFKNQLGTEIQLIN